MIDIDKIEEAAKRHGNDADWQGAAIAYETHVTPSVVLEMVSLIRLQEAGLNAEQARYESLSEAFASIPAQTGMQSLEWDAVNSAANTANNNFGQWMPERWLQEFVKAYNASIPVQPVQQPAPVTADERAAFESLCRNNAGAAAPLQRSESGAYCNYGIQAQWVGWKARSAIAQRAAPVAAPVARLKALTPDQIQAIENKFNWHNARACGTHIRFANALIDAMVVTPVPTASVQGGVDWLGGALELEAQAKKVSSKSAQRVMESGAQRLRMMGQKQSDSGTAASVQPGFDMPLRKAVQQMTLALNENEWADLLTTDPDAAALEEAIRDVLETAGQLGDPQPDSGRDAALVDLIERTIDRLTRAQIFPLASEWRAALAAHPANVAQPVSDAALQLLLRLEPHLDVLVCYASTTSEYEPNKLVQEVRALLAAPGAVPVVGQEPVAEVSGSSRSDAGWHATVRWLKFEKFPRVGTKLYAAPVPAASVQPDRELMRVLGMAENDDARDIMAMAAMRIKRLQAMLPDSGRDAALVKASQSILKACETGAAPFKVEYALDKLKEGKLRVDLDPDLLFALFLALAAHPANVAQVGELSDEKIIEIMLQHIGADAEEAIAFARAILAAAKKGPTT